MADEGNATFSLSSSLGDRELSYGDSVLFDIAANVEMTQQAVATSAAAFNVNSEYYLVRNVGATAFTISTDSAAANPVSRLAPGGFAILSNSGSSDTYTMYLKTASGTSTALLIELGEST